MSPIAKDSNSKTRERWDFVSVQVLSIDPLGKAVAVRVQAQVHGMTIDRIETFKPLDGPLVQFEDPKVTEYRGLLRRCFSKSLFINSN